MRRRRNKPPHEYPVWSAAEQRVVRRYAAALVRGRYPDALEAARHCRDELDQKVWSSGRAEARTRSLEAVHIRVAQAARKIGRPGVCVRWTEHEKRLLDRYALAIAGGRYLSTHVAARDCCREMARLPARFRGRGPGVRGPAARRSAEAIRGKLFARAHELLPLRFGTEWAPAEDRIIDRYARAGLARPHDSMRRVAAACHAALVRRSNRSRRRSRLGLRSVSTRSAAAVYIRVRQRMLELGRQKVVHQPWTPWQVKVVAKYARWYRASLGTRRPLSLAGTARSVRAELEKHGVYRSFGGCVIRLRHVLYPR
jgi:hypothetical protein